MSGGLLGRKRAVGEEEYDNATNNMKHMKYIILTTLDNLTFNSYSRLLRKLIHLF